MGLGDEILALGEAEKRFADTKTPVAICKIGGYPRQHDAWKGSPAVDENSKNKIINGGGARPYIKHWSGRKAVYNLDYEPKAGKIWLTESEKAHCDVDYPFIVISPHVKPTASKNKEYDRWEEVIKDLPLPVLQLVPDDTIHIINGAKKVVTPHFRHACAWIAKAKLVLTNEGGAHHMAASMGTPAIVYFGSFIPPTVTGYKDHVNIIAGDNPHFCGNFDYCKECHENKKKVSPDYIRSWVMEYLKDE